MASLHPGASELVSVSGTVLRVLGSATWTGACPATGTDRTVELTNCGPVPVFVGRFAASATLAVAVSPSAFSARLGPGEGPLNVFVPAGQDLAVVTAGAATSVLASSFTEVE
jgi:hypothetical protein